MSGVSSLRLVRGSFRLTPATRKPAHAHVVVAGMIRSAPRPEGDQEDGRSTGKGNFSRASVRVASRPVKEGGDMVRAVTGAAHAVSSLYRHAMAHPGRCQMSVGPDQTFGPARSRRLHARQLPAQRTRVGRPTPGQPPGATRRPRPPACARRGRGHVPSDPAAHRDRTPGDRCVTRGDREPDPRRAAGRATAHDVATEAVQTRLSTTRPPTTSRAASVATPEIQ